MSIFASKSRRDSSSVFESALGVGRGDKGCGGVEGARGRYVAGSRRVVVAVLSFHVGLIFVQHTGGPVFSSMSSRHKKSFQFIWGRAGRGRRWSGLVS